MHARPNRAFGAWSMEAHARQIPVCTGMTTHIIPAACAGHTLLELTPAVMLNSFQHLGTQCRQAGEYGRYARP